MEMWDAILSIVLVICGNALIALAIHLAYKKRA